MDVPADILRNARSVAIEARDAAEDGMDFEPIARALMAERERCATIARSMQLAGEDSPKLQSYNHACRDIEREILGV